MFQESEIIDLGLACFAMLLIFAGLIRNDLARHRFFYIAFFCLCASLIFTVTEGFIWEKFFNLLEHLGYAFTGLFSFLGCLSLKKWSEEKEENSEI